MFYTSMRISEDVEAEAYTKYDEVYSHIKNTDLMDAAGYVSVPKSIPKV